MANNSNPTTQTEKARENPRKYITADYLEQKLSKGWTTEMFATDLMVSPDYVENYLITQANKKSSFSSTYAGYLKKLHQNNDKQAKELERELKQKSKAEEQPPKSTNIKKTETEPVLSPTDAKINALLETISGKEAILGLRKKVKSNYSASLSGIERQLIEKEKTIALLTHDLEEEKKIHSELREQQKTLLENVKFCDSEISSIEGEIINIRSKIMELQKIIVRIHIDGKVELNKPLDVPKDSSDIFQKLVSDDLVSSAQIYQVRLLAKLLSILKVLKKQQLYYEFVFESDKEDTDDNVKVLFELLSDKTW